MIDFFNSENPAESEISAEETQDVRDKIQAEIFDGVPAKFNDSPEVENNDSVDDSVSSDSVPADSDTAEKEVTPEVDSEPEVDVAVEPSALSPEMQAIVDSVHKLTSSLTGMEDRIKQTERRVGGISNEFYAAKEAAATQAKAPTPEEMAVAAKNESAWEDLKKDFPSWADAISSKIQSQATSFVSVDAFEELRKNVSQIPSVDTQQLEARLVGLIHPDHKQIVSDPDYAVWLNNQSEEIKTKAYKGTTAEDAIDVFNQFKAQRVSPADNSLSEVQQIQKKRKKRLESSTTTNPKHKTIRQKVEADMNEEELREHIANKVFAEK